MKSRLLILTVVALVLFPKVTFPQTPNLRSVINFVLFTTTGAVGNTGLSSITGKIGTNAGAITNFTPIPGQEENGNAVTAQAVTDLQLLYDELHASVQSFPSHSAVLGNGETLIPGTYLIPAAGSIEGNLILNAQGNANAIFIIKVNGAFAPGPSSQISLSGGAQACNIFWAVEGGEVAIAASSLMKGTFIANPGAVSMAASSQLEGRLLSTTGAVAVDNVIASLPVCSVLPITLISFTATKNNSVVELSWVISNEVSFKGYDLERSADGRGFYGIGSVIPTNTTAVKTYKWLDETPLPAKNFYRLKMIDLDHAYAYSPIVGVSMDTKKSISSYPNPVVDHTIFLKMSGQLKGEYIINLYNNSGKKIMNTKILLGSSDTVNEIPLYKNLPKGVYILQLTDPEKKVKTLRILLQ
jgi:hypothetical protein